MGFGALVAIWMSGLIVRPLREAVDQINALAEGELKEWPDPGREDELGQMSRALNRAVLGLRGVLEADSVDWDEIADQRRREAAMRAAEAERIEREREEAQRIQEKEREEAQRLQEKVDRVLGIVRLASGGDLTARVDIPDGDAVGQIGGGLNEMLGDLSESISQLARNAATLGEASRNLSSVTDSIGGEASETSGRATQASDAAGKVSDHVRSVAAATEEMSATVRDIARNAAHAAEVARNAVEMAHNTNQTMEPSAKAARRSDPWSAPSRSSPRRPTCSR